MKKFFVAALTALMLFGFGASVQAQCCDGVYDGEYCGRYGCR